MANISKLLFFLAIIVLPFTLIKDVGYFRIYTVDIVLIPLCFTFLFGAMFNMSTYTFKLLVQDWIALAIMLAVSVSLIFSSDLGNSLVKYMDWVRCFLFYFIGRSLMSNGVVTADGLKKCFISVGVILVVVGLIQIITQTRFGLIANYFGEGTGEGGTAQLGTFNVVNRVSGTGPNPNIYAMWLGLFYSLILVVLAHKERFILFYTATAAGIIVVFSSLARGGTLAFVGFLLLLAIMNSKKLLDGKFIVSSLIVFLILITVIITSVYVYDIRVGSFFDAFSARLEQADDENSSASAEGRLDLVWLGFQVIQNPKIFFFGFGADNFPNGIIIHNMWMRFWTEQGGIVLFLLIYFIFSTFRANKRLKGIDREEIIIWRRYLAATIPSFLLINTQVYHTAGSYDILIPLSVLSALIVSESPVLKRTGNI